MRLKSYINPQTTGSAVAFVGIVLASAAVASAGVKRRRKRVAQQSSTGGQSRDELCLSGVYFPGATLDASVLDDLLISTFDKVPVSQVVVDIAKDRQFGLYNAALDRILKDIPRTSDALDAMTQALLQSGWGAPNCDWSEGLGPYTFGSPFQRVWSGTSVILKMALANLEDKGVIPKILESGSTAKCTWSVIKKPDGFYFQIYGEDFGSTNDAPFATQDEAKSAMFLKLQEKGCA